MLKKFLDNYAFRNYKMKNQAIIIQFLILLVVVILIIVIMAINSSFAIEILQESQNRLLKQSIQKNLIDTTTQLDEKIRSHFLRIFELLDKVNEIYDFAIDQVTNNPQLDNSPYPLPCNESAKNPSQLILSLPSFCYYYTNNKADPFTIPPNTQDIILSSFVKHLNQMLVNLELTTARSNLYIAHNGETQFFTITPMKQYRSSYVPKARPWYQNHVQHITQYPNDQFSISDVYTAFSQAAFLVTLTRSLTNKGQFDGIIAYDTDFTELNLDYPGITIFLLDRLGRILTTNMKLNDNVNFASNSSIFYNSSLTGFNELDWEQIKNLAKYGYAESNCPYDLEQFCRLNTLYDIPVGMTAKTYRDSFYIVIFVDIDIVEVQSEYMTYILQLIIDKVGVALIIQVSISLLVLLLSWIILNRIFNPIDEIQERFIEIIQAKNRYRINKVTQPIKSGSNNIITQLLYSCQLLFDKLNNLARKKSIQCKLFEQYKYPRNQQDRQNNETGQLDLKEIKDNTPLQQLVSAKSQPDFMCDQSFRDQSMGSSKLLHLLSNRQRRDS